MNLCMPHVQIVTLCDIIHVKEETTKHYTRDLLCS